MYDEDAQPRALGMNRISDDLKDAAYEIQRERAEQVKVRQYHQRMAGLADEQIMALDRMLLALGNANRTILAEQQVRVAALSQEHPQ